MSVGITNKSRKLALIFIFTSEHANYSRKLIIYTALIAKDTMID